jgi:cell division protein FtsB
MAKRNVMQGLVPRIAVGVVGLMTVGMLLLAVFDPHGALAVRRQRAKLAEVTAHVAQLTAQNDKLRKEIELLRTDEATIERIAREELGLVKPGEVVLRAPAKN